MGGRVEIEPHDIADLVDQQRVRRHGERLGAMRLESEGAPDAVHRCGAQATGASHRARAPLRRAARSRLKRPRDHRVDLRIG